MKNEKKLLKIAKYTPWAMTMLVVFFSVIMSSMENGESQLLSNRFSNEIQRLAVSFATYSRDATNFEIYEAVNFILRKFAHMFIFYNVFLLLSVSFRTIFKSIWSSMAVSCVSTLALAILDEIHQVFVAGRTASFEDVIIDMTGAVLAFLTLVAIIIVNKLVDFFSLGWKSRDEEKSEEN